MCYLASIIPVRYTLGSRCAGADPYKLMESKATACDPGTAERYINPHYSLPESGASLHRSGLASISSTIEELKN